MKAFILAAVALMSCGHSNDTEVTDRRTTGTVQQTEVDDLRQQVLALQGTIAMINAFTANDFSNCNVTLPPFERKVCQIAQTAVAESQVDFFSALAEVSKLLQGQLFGTDCLNTTDPGCPVLGSVTSDLAVLQASVASHTASINTINSQIATLQTSLSTVQASVTAINTRLNNFNGTGSSIETVVTGINSTLATLNSRVSAIEATVGTGQTWSTVKLCGNIAASGPVFEAMLLSGNRLELVAYVQVTGSQHGLGQVALAGSTGTQYLQTALNSSTCKFKVYDLTTQLKLCWKNTDKAASSASIDTACNYPTFSGVNSTCTCK